LGRLTGGVAHDFNNLLMVVSNNLFLLRRLHPGVADCAQLAAIDRAVAAGSKLTRQLLSFSRRHALHPERVNSQQHLSAVLDMLRPAPESAIHLSARLDADTSPIEVDTAEVELALLNLAINARTAMPELS
jgi:signal transduction histidine kinase